MKEKYLENRTMNPKTNSQHSKFYRMKQIDAYTFEATWGKIGTSGRSQKYSMDEWWDVLDKRRGNNYTVCTENVDDFQSQLNPEIIAKLEKLITRVEARGVMSDLPKAKALLNKYKRMRTLDKEAANALFLKYNKENTKIRQEKAKSRKAVSVTELDADVKKAVIINNFDLKDGWDPEVRLLNNNDVEIIFPEFPPSILEEHFNDFAEVIQNTVGGIVTMEDREYFIIDDVPFKEVVDFLLTFKL